LRSLRLIAPEIIVFGFEKVADIDGVKDNLITIDVTDTSLGKIIQLITKQDPRYYYDIVGNRLIEVYPVGSKKESTNLLNLRIDKVFIEEKCAPTRIISRFPEYLPELSYLIKKSGTLVGAEMRGNMDPEIRINLHNVKVREFLNQVSLYSLDLSKKTSTNYASGWKCQKKRGMDSSIYNTNLVCEPF
jgi:hypothetical protein